RHGEHRQYQHRRFHLRQPQQRPSVAGRQPGSDRPRHRRRHSRNPDCERRREYPDSHTDHRQLHGHRIQRARSSTEHSRHCYFFRTRRYRPLHRPSDTDNRSHTCGHGGWTHYRDQYRRHCGRRRHQHPDYPYSSDSRLRQLDRRTVVGLLQ
ncbi:hypothetical protein DSJ18_04455, partial [Mycobacterium tuberculosis]